MATKYSFRQCTIILLEKLFNVREIHNMPLLTHWLEHEAEISDDEKKELLLLQENLLRNLRNWNETELAYEFIAPIVRLVNFSGENRRFFAERPLSSKISAIELSGKADGIIASGLRLSLIHI